jgi:TonB family protein
VARTRSFVPWAAAPLGLWLSAGIAMAAPAEDPLSDLTRLAGRAKDIRVERRVWDGQETSVKTAASASATAAWLGRLLESGLAETGRIPDSLCAVACRRCIDQLHVDVSFKVGSEHYFLSLYMREGLAFMRADKAVGWNLPDSLGPLLTLLREALPTDDIIRAWSPPSTRPAPLDPSLDSDILVTGLPERLFGVAPSYPAEARRLGISGVVHVQTLVRADGTVDRVFASKSIPELDEAAFAAVRAYKFKPAICGGRPVAVWVINPVRFTLR